MKALIDGDILRYEIGFAAEAGWRAKINNMAVMEYQDPIPPWSYVQDLLHQRIEQIVYEAGADSYQIYLTKGRSFRFDIAKTKPYKGQRVENKPWHFKNLTAYMTGALGAIDVEGGLEADDAMAIQSLQESGQYIICSRDKDLRQVPGWIYSWELGNQTSFGPTKIQHEGSLALTENSKLTGTGFAWFCAQVLMGDKTDNIPGLKGCGKIKTYNELSILDTPEEMYQKVYDLYPDEEFLLEQGQLCWMVRRLTDTGEPELWSLGQTQ